MVYIVFYDISSTPVRTRVAKLLMSAGYERIQLSVYLGIKNPKKDKMLWPRLVVLLAQQENAKVYSIAISKQSFRAMAQIGSFDLDIPYLLGESRSLII